MGNVQEVDVAIIGAGTAGLAALVQVLRKTDRVVVINDSPYGTTCARAGCMPSKVLVGAARDLTEFQPAPEKILRPQRPSQADRARVLDEVRRVRGRFVGEVAGYVNDFSRYHRRGHARFLEPTLLELEGEQIRARKVILATGSSPTIPEAWRAFGKRLVTTETLFELETLPERMAAVGLGGIAVALVQAAARLGVEVTAFDERLLVAGLTDERVNAYLLGALRQDMVVSLGCEPVVTENADGTLRVATPNLSVDVDALFVALDRRPNLGSLGLERLGLQPGSESWRVNPQTMRLNDLPIYIAGDATMFRTLLHEATDDGAIAGMNAVNDFDVPYRRRVGLRLAYTTPEAAVVGRPFAELDEVVVGERAFESLPRAVANAVNKGILRVYAEQSRGKILGAEMAVPGAEHIAHLLALAIDRDLTARELLRIPFYHPTLEEGLAESLKSIVAQVEGAGHDEDSFLSPQVVSGATAARPTSLVGQLGEAGC